jgi:hypothetical protein
MTYGPCQRRPKGRASQSRSYPATRFRSTARRLGQLAQDCSISPRQAYRYLQQAQRLKEPLAVSEPKLAFTVKLPPSLIQRVRLYASVKNLSISEVVSRALLTLLPRGRGRG